MRSNHHQPQEWAELDPVELLSNVPHITASEFRALCSTLRVPMDPPLNGKYRDEPFADSVGDELPPRVAKLVADRKSMLGRRWHGDTEGLKDTSRSGVAHAIACGLVKRFVPTTDIATAIRVWGRQQGYENVERDDWIKTTLGNAYDFITKNAATTEELDDEPRVIEFERIMCAELAAANYDLEYLIPGVLVAQQPMVFAGSRKSLKTSMMVDMAISLATGGYWLRKFKVNRACRVAMMSGESGLATLQETAKRVADAAGKRLENIDGLIWSPSIPRFDSRQHLDALRDLLTADEIEVVLIDPAYLAIPGGDAGNLFIQGEMLRRVTELCQSVGAGLILAHHTKRGGIADPYAPAELEHIAWAGFQEYARQWVLLSRREQYEPGSGVHRLWVSLGSSAGHSGLWAVDIDEGVYSEDMPRHWDVAIRPPDEVRQDDRKQAETAKAAKKKEQATGQLENDKKDVCDYLAKCKEGDTRKGIKDHIMISTDRLNRAVGALLDEEAIVGVEVQKHTRKEHGFRLNTEEKSNV